MATEKSAAALLGEHLLIAIVPSLSSSLEPEKAKEGHCSEYGDIGKIGPL